MTRLTKAVVTLAAPAVLVATLVAGPARAAGDPYVVDWGAKRLHLGDTGRFAIDFSPGDAPFLLVRDLDGEVFGGIELAEFPDLGPDHPIRTDGWEAWVEDLYDTVEEDRKEGCDPGYRVERDPVVPADFGSGEGVRYGFSGQWPDGRPSERVVFHAVIHDDQLFILVAGALADDSCVPRETEMTLDVFPDLEPFVARIAAASVLPDRGVPAIRRFAGTDRYGTAAAVAAGSFGGGSDVAVVASGETFPDALAASYLAGRRIAPILLTRRADAPTALLGSLEHLGTTAVVVVGGTGAVSDAVAERLRGSGVSVTRVAGEDRYATAAAIAGSAGAEGIGSLEPDGPPSAILASGESFADALSAAPLAFAAGIPVLLTPRDALAPPAREALVDLGIGQVAIAGGTGAVSDAVAAQVSAMGIAVRRVAGADRTRTAAAFADLAMEAFGFQRHNVVLARGDAFADALTAGVHAGSRISPLLLTAGPADLGGAADAWLRRVAGGVSTLHVVGGTAAVGDAVAAAARDAASAR